MKDKITFLNLKLQNVLLQRSLLSGHQKHSSIAILYRNITMPHDNNRVSSNRTGQKNRKIGHCNPKK